VVLRQPLVQHVTGKIALYPSHLDLLGDQASANVMAAQENDVHVAGVALIAYINPTQRYYDPTLPATPTLEVSGMTCAQSFCRRSTDAADRKEDELTFSFDFDVREFLGGMGGPPSATDSVLLVVWTTSGAIFEHPILLWPVFKDDSAPDLLATTYACNGVTGRGLPGQESSGGCTSDAQMEDWSCTGTYTSWTRQILMGPILGVGASAQDKDVFMFAGFPTVTELGGMAATMSGTCNPPPPSGVSSGNYDATCFAGNASAINKSTRTTGSGACPSIPAMPMVPHTAVYRGEVGPAANYKTMLETLFGRSDFPTWTTTLQ
jgi:hypothetical protein